MSSYGHAGTLIPACAHQDGCDRPALIKSEADDGRLLCARHGLDALAGAR